MSLPMPQGPRPSQTTLDAIAISPRGRALFLGMTGCGKSTVKERLIYHWRDSMPRPRILILDSKPRFRAEWHLNGTSASRLYRKWRRGPAVPDSVLLPLVAPQHLPAALNAVWKRGHTIAIAQVSDQRLVPWLSAVANAFYLSADDKYSQLVDVDELADFYGTTGYARNGDALLKIARSGREMNVSLAAAAQRPKGLPKSFLTELSEVLIFEMANVSDLEHLEDMGLPGTYPLPDEPHVFYHYRRKGKRGGLYRLHLEE